jgi:signal transduction histidine kinase
VGIESRVVVSVLALFRAASRLTEEGPYEQPDDRGVWNFRVVGGRNSISDTISRLIGLGFLIAGLYGSYAVAVGDTRTVIAVLGGVCAATWLVWGVTGRVAASLPEGSPRRQTFSACAGIAVCVFGLVGALLAGLEPQTAAAVFPCVATITVTIRTSPRFSTAFVTILAVVTVGSGVPVGHPVGSLGFASLYFGLFGLSLGRRSTRQRAQTAEQLLAETERANAQQAQAAALAERSRIAREIHDVLAHSLAALSVQLEAADALLGLGTDPQRAHAHVVNARQIAREGLAETRRAIAALREDTPPLRSLLDVLADAYKSDTGATATVVAHSEPTGLAPDAALAVYRTAQEALTNVRKHAPGAVVEVTLTEGDGVVELAVVNGPARDAPSYLASSGGGYGLTGLKERAELAGGTLEAGPCDAPASAPVGVGGRAVIGNAIGWQVRLRIPAATGGRSAA